MAKPEANPEKPQTSNESWRVFCAIELPPATRARVLEHITMLKQAVPEARASWARDESLHLTLKFLGNIPTRSITNLSAAAAKAVGGISPFLLSLEGAGAFPKPGQPRVLWIGVRDDSGKLHQLQAQLEEQAATAGFEKEGREFKPHLTVARLRNPQHARELAASHLQLNFEPADVKVSELLVIRSELSSKGSKYTVISRHALQTESKVQSPMSKVHKN